MQASEKQLRRQKLASEASVLVGIDAGKHKIGAIRRVRPGPNGKAMEFAVDRNGFTALQDYIHHALPAPVAPSDVLIGIELAGVYGLTLVQHFRDQGYRVVGVQPRHVKAHAEVVHNQRLKTDRKDAATIVDLVSLGRFFDVAHGDAAYIELRQLVSTRDSLDRKRTAAINRLRTFLQVVFPEFEKLWGKKKIANPTPLALLRQFPGPADILDPARQVELEELLQRTSRGHARGKRTLLIQAASRTLGLTRGDTALRFEIPLLAAQLELLVAQQRATEDRIERLLTATGNDGNPRFPEVRWLRTMPTLGYPTIASFLGAVGDVRSYRSWREVRCRLGLGLVERSSGQHYGKPRLSKRGDPTFRKMLYFLIVRNSNTGKAAQPDSTPEASREPGEFRAAKQRPKQRGVLRDWFEQELARTTPPGTATGLAKKAITNMMRKFVVQMYCVARERRAWTVAHPASGAVTARPERAHRDTGVRSGERRARSSATEHTTAATQRCVSLAEAGQPG